MVLMSNGNHNPLIEQYTNFCTKYFNKLCYTPIGASGSSFVVELNYAVYER